MENFRSHCSVDMGQGENTSNNQQFENLSNAGTPVNDETQQSTMQEDQWTQFRPLNNPIASASSTATTVIYSDLEEYIQTHTDMETLPEPAPKKMCITSAEATKTTDPVMEKLERIESKLEKMEFTLKQLQSCVENQITNTSISQQHYNRSLAGALQKDIGSLKDMLRNSTSKDLIKSIVEFNNSLLKVVQVDRGQEVSQ